MNAAMKKFRVVIRCPSGRKLTRHVRALDAQHAHEQARIIAAAQPPRERGEADTQISVVPIGGI